MDQGRLLGPGLRFLVGAASAVVVMAGLRAAAAAVVPIVFALFLAIVSQPLLERLRRVPLPAGRRLPQGLAVLLTVAADVTVLVAVVLILTSSFDDFMLAFPRYQRGLAVMAAAPLAWAESQGYPLSSLGLPDLISPEAALSFFRGTAATLTRGLTFFLLVLLTLVFALLEGPRLPGKLHLAFGRESRAEERLQKVAREVQTYLRVKTLVSLATGILFGLWLALLGVDFAILWGFLAFILNYIPNLGSILAVIPPALLALMQNGPGRALAVVLGALVVNQVLSNAIEPHLMGRSLGLSPIVVVVALVFWGWIWGAAGVILAVPLTVMLKILMENSQDLRWLAVLLEPNPAPPRHERG